MKESQCKYSHWNIIVISFLLGWSLGIIMGFVIF